MEKIKSSLDSALGSVSQELENWTLEMNNVLKSNLTDTNDVLLNFVENLDNAVEMSEKAATNFNSEIVVTINDAQKLGKNVTDLSKGIDKRVDSADDYMNRINDASSKLIADTDKVTDALQELVNKLSSGDNSFSKSMEQFEKIDDCLTTSQTLLNQLREFHNHLKGASNYRTKIMTSDFNYRQR